MAGDAGPVQETGLLAEAGRREGARGQRARAAAAGPGEESASGVAQVAPASEVELEAGREPKPRVRTAAEIRGGAIGVAAATVLRDEPPKAGARGEGASAGRVTKRPLPTPVGGVASGPATQPTRGRVAPVGVDKGHRPVVVKGVRPVPGRVRRPLAVSAAKGGTAPREDRWRGRDTWVTAPDIAQLPDEVQALVQ